MALQETPLHIEARRGGEAALVQAGHHFTKGRNVVLRLLGAGGSDDPDISHLAAQPAERPLVHDSGARQPLAPADADPKTMA
jgi:hypothetical protein